MFSFGAHVSKTNDARISNLPDLAEFEAPLLAAQNFGDYTNKIQEGFLQLPTIKRAVARRPSYDPEEIDCIKACIDSLLHCGIIEKAKRRGPFLAYPKVIPKPNGKPRFLVDYSKLTNNITAPKCSLPPFTRLLRRTRVGSRWKAVKIDFSNAFFSVPIAFCGASRNQRQES